MCTVSQARRLVAATWLLAAILALPRNWIQVVVKIVVVMMMVMMVMVVVVVVVRGSVEVFLRR